MCSLFTDAQIRQVSKLPNLGDDVALETERVTWPLETERVTWQWSLGNLGDVAVVRRSPEISHRRVGVHTGNGRAGVTVGDLGPRGTSRDLGPKNRELGSEVEITEIRTQISRLREVGRGRSRLAGGRRSRRDLGPQIWAQSPYHVGGHTPVPFGHHRHITSRDHTLCIPLTDYRITVIHLVVPLAEPLVVTHALIKREGSTPYTYCTQPRTHAAPFSLSGP